MTTVDAVKTTADTMELDELLWRILWQPLLAGEYLLDAPGKCLVIGRVERQCPQVANEPLPRSLIGTDAFHQVQVLVFLLCALVALDDLFDEHADMVQGRGYLSSENMSCVTTLKRGPNFDHRL
ncbi:MAG: hypothetical protein AB1798_08675, partial [Spirochaetota bacterium]